MTIEEIAYVDNLIFSRLAQHQSVKIDELGVLKCELESTKKNYSSNVSEVPHHKVTFVKDETSTEKLLSDVIAQQINCAPKEAREMVAEWKEGVKTVEKGKEVYKISKVGQVVCAESSVEFKCDGELLKFLQPVTIKDVKKPVVVGSVDGAGDASKSKKPLLLTLAALACVGVLSVVGVKMMDNEGVKTSEKSVNVAVLDTVMTDISVSTTLPDTVNGCVDLSRLNVHDKGYYVIVNTFVEKENAEKCLEKLSKEESGAMLFIVDTHKITPYFVSVGRFDTREAAQEVVRSAKYDEAWIYSIN